MANTIVTLTAGDVTRKALSILHNNLVFCRSISREYDSRFATSGAKNGGYLQIREPNQFSVRTGRVIDVQDVEEETNQLVVATQKGVDINFSSSELTLSLDDFAERILEPAMSRLAAEVEKTVLDSVYAECYKTANTAWGSQPDLTDILTARAKLQQGLAPTSNRHVLVDALAANTIISTAQGLYHAGSEIERQFNTGFIGQIYGFKFFESEMIPSHTTGSRSSDADYTCDTQASSSSIESGTATVTITASTTSGTIAEGDVFTIGGLYDVNPETKTTSASLKQWVATGTATVDTTTGIVTVSVAPTPQLSGAKKNVDVSTSSASAVVIHLTAGAGGAASTTYKQNLAYHKDAFTMVTADLEMPQGVDFAYRSIIDGISLRLVRQYDITNDRFPCRIDVLFGQKAIRPEWAVRLPY